MRLLCSFIRYIADGPERNETQQKCKGNLMLLLGFISFAAWDARRGGSVRLFAAWAESDALSSQVRRRETRFGGIPRQKIKKYEEEDL